MTLTDDQQKLFEHLLEGATCLIFEGIRLNAPFGIANSKPAGHLMVYVRDPDLADKVEILIGKWLHEHKAKRQAEDG